MTQSEAVPMLILRAATEAVEGIQQGLVTRGFADVRPAHGFAFVRLSHGDATVADIAGHLGVTKQAASQLVEQLVQRGYVSREANPADGRAWLLTLTDRGWACTRAAEEAAAEIAAQWRNRLEAKSSAAWPHFASALAAVVTPGLIRPTW